MKYLTLILLSALGFSACSSGPPDCASTEARKTVLDVLNNYTLARARGAFEFTEEYMAARRKITAIESEIRKSPVCQYDHPGDPHDWMYDYWNERARGIIGGSGDWVNIASDIMKSEPDLDLMFADENRSPKEIEIMDRITSALKKYLSEHEALCGAAVSSATKGLEENLRLEEIATVGRLVPRLDNIRTMGANPAAKASSCEAEYVVAERPLRITYDLQLTSENKLIASVR